MRTEVSEMLLEFADDLARVPDPALFADFDYDPERWPVSRGNPDDYNPILCKTPQTEEQTKTSQTLQTSRQEYRGNMLNLPLRKKLVLALAITGLSTVIMIGAEIVSTPEQTKPQPACHYVRIDPLPTTSQDPTEMLIQAQGKQLEQQLPQLPRYECQTPATR